MGQLYYNVTTGETTTNVCAYGNHDACLNEDGDCQCSYPNHLIEHINDAVNPPEGPEPPPEEMQTSYS